MRTSAMTVVLGISLTMFGQVNAADCTKAEAKKAVEYACEQIEKSGKEGLKVIDKYKYCGQNYVWIQDSPGIKIVLHPIKRKLIHKDYGGRNKKDLKSFADKNGKKIFTEFDKMALSTSEGGWVDYVWPKPGAETATPKISFVKKCGGGLNWVAGSGIWK